MNTTTTQSGFFKKNSERLKIFLMRQFSKFIQPEKVVYVFGTSINQIAAFCTEAMLQENMTAIASVIEGDDASWQTNLASTMIKINKKVDKAIFSIPENAYMYDPEMFSFIQPKTIVAIDTPSSDGVTNAKNQFLQFLEDISDKMGKKGLLIFNWHDSALRKLGEEAVGETLFFGFNSEFCHVWASNIRVSQSQSSFELNHGVERVEINCRMLGKRQIEAILAAATVAVQSGVALTSIKKAVEKMGTVEHKLQLLDGLNGSVLLDDTYDDGVESWADALETLNKLPARRRIVVLEAIKGLGEGTEKLHRELGQMLYKEHIDIVLCGTGDALFTSDEMKKLGFYEGRLEENMSASTIVSRLVKIVGKGDLILVKGGKNHFDDLIKKMTVKK